MTRRLTPREAATRPAWRETRPFVPLQPMDAGGDATPFWNWVTIALTILVLVLLPGRALLHLLGQAL